MFTLRSLLACSTNGSSLTGASFPTCGVSWHLDLSGCVFYFSVLDGFTRGDFDSVPNADMPLCQTIFESAVMPATRNAAQRTDARLYQTNPIYNLHCISVELENGRNFCLRSREINPHDRTPVSLFSGEIH